MKAEARPDARMDETRKAMPVASRDLLQDFRHYIFNKPHRKTLIKFAREGDRKEYSRRIMQRLGRNVSEYAILNIHKIGIDAPAMFIFRELLQWDGSSICWPNHIAPVERVDGRLEHIRIYLFGRKKPLFGVGTELFGLRFIPLFQLDALDFQMVPGDSDLDNARYLLYECSGGYPIGMFSMYTRSSIPARAEKTQSQLFLAVWFDFYGKKDWPRKHLVNDIWETIHNRVTANIMNRFKQMCEAKFQSLVAGTADRYGGRPGYSPLSAQRSQRRRGC